MRYISAVQAAKRIGVSEKTVRLWIQDGKLQAHHPNGQRNKLAIPEQEVERLARERQQYATPGSEQTTQPDISALVARIASLEQEVSTLKQKITLPEKEKGEKPPIMPQMVSNTQENARALKTSITGHREAKGLPEGAILARHFAESYGVSPGTFRGHYEIGLGPGREKAPISSREDPARSDGKMQWYLLPEQVSQVLDYWRRHGVKFREDVSTL